MYTFSLFGSLVVRAEIRSSKLAKSNPMRSQPGAALKHLFIGLAYGLLDDGICCIFTMFNTVR